jgi:hypothetical protein
MSVAKPTHRAEHVLMRIPVRTTLIAASVAAAALAVGAPSASAGLLVKSAPDCSPKPTSAAFSKIDGDSTQYWLAPGGDFEAGSQPWSLSGRASIVSGNEPWKLAGSDDSRSLRLPPGASATSPVVCVGIEHPAVRLFAKTDSGLLPTLVVDVITETSLGLKLAVPAGVLLPNGRWKPSPKLIVLSSLLPLLPGEHTPVQFRVTSVGLGTWSVDDFYIDPRCRF